MIADIDIDVRRALERNQWGSCDGCGGHHYCPECKAPRIFWVEDDEKPGIHYHGCSIAAALELPTRTEP